MSIATLPQPKRLTEKQLLTHSRTQSFKNCRRRHFIEYEIGLRPENDAKALRMGSAGHEALDVLKKTGDKDAAVAAVGEYYDSLPAPVDQWEGDIERETMECLIAGYHWRWGADELNIVASEQSFRLPLVNPATGKPTPLWDLAGKIDGIILVNGRKLVLEHKFISEAIESGADYWKKLQIDPQTNLYTHAGRQLGHDVCGVLQDVIRKPTIRPTQIPLLDDEGRKIVLDAQGQRVFNRLKPNKKCKWCRGSGTIEGDEPDEPCPCICTRGKPRQTGDKEKGYVLQSRPMTRKEWGERLLADIGERPDFYYARHEIARLDDDIDEMMEEVWDVQQTIRNAQKTGRWFKTVGHDNCKYCPFFAMCVSKTIPTDHVPDGFVKLDNPHPEL